MKVLLTGFGPFKDFSINPSQIIVEKFEMEEVILKKKIFEVDKEAIEASYISLLDGFQPDFIINIGLNAGSGALNLETFAINSLKDKEQFSDISHPPGFRTFVDTDAISEHLCRQGIPAIRSDYAGSYYCNFIYYLSLQWCEKNQGSSLFLHIPFTTKLASDYCKEKKKAVPSLDDEIIISGIKEIIYHIKGIEV